MTPRKVHALLAASLANPSLIEALRHEPDRVRRYGVEPGSVDLAALQSFAGLTAKVRHTALRDELPMTFRLLSTEGLEIDVFAAYALHVSLEGRQFAPTTAERARDFIAFVGTWLDRENPTHLLLWDLMRHEHSIARLTQSRVRPPGEARAGELRPRPPGGAPCLRGEVLLHEMTSDPRVAIARLQGREPDLRGLGSAERYVAYWSPYDASGMSVVDLDLLGYCTLRMVDGETSALEIDRALGGKGRKPRKNLLRLLQQLAAIGIIAFDDPDGSA
jgi:hypothetical protein